VKPNLLLVTGAIVVLIGGAPAPCHSLVEQGSTLPLAADLDRVEDWIQSENQPALFHGDRLIYREYGDLGSELLREARISWESGDPARADRALRLALAVIFQPLNYSIPAGAWVEYQPKGGLVIARTRIDLAETFQFFQTRDAQHSVQWALAVERSRRMQFIQRRFARWLLALFEVRPDGADLYGTLERHLVAAQVASLQQEFSGLLDIIPDITDFRR
jgi:hypothetical protein